jgi:hypothetical protein
MKHSNSLFTYNVKNCEYGTMADEMIKDRIVDILQANHTTNTKNGGSQSKRTIDIQRVTLGSSRMTGQTCQNCGGNHQPRRCPAYGKTCNACNKLNHFAKLC